MEQGLRALRDSRESDLQAHHQRVAIVDDPLAQHKRKIERLTKAFGDEEDELNGASLQQEMRATKRGYDALQREKDQVESQIMQRQITEDKIAKIEGRLLE